jgi:predicted ester cyclase
VVVENVYQDGNTQTGRCTVTATHTSSGKPVKFSGISIAEFNEEGKMINGWNSFDFLTMNMQLGKISAEQLL